MTLPGETGHANSKCIECGADLPAKILNSGAGYYIGTFCPNCGPYSRESGYYPTREAAQEALDNNTFYRL